MTATRLNEAEQLHEFMLAWSGGHEPGRDVRRSTRLPFRSQQRIASYRGDIPPYAEFQTITCQDLSTGGFSFVTANPPEQDTLICQFRGEAQYVYLIAQVQHVKRLADGMLYQIGCRFLRKLEDA